MLSRTASNLYWMARYMKRAESTARLLDACFMPGMPFDGNITQLYALPLHIQDVYNEFILQNGNQEINVENVSRFLISGNSPSTVRGSLELARENARSERSRLSSEVWETINQAWLEFQQEQRNPVSVFTEWLKQKSFLFQGTVQVTMPKTHSLYFIKLGTFIERANQTLRVLEANNKLYKLINIKTDDYYHWVMLLRSVSSFEAYREVFDEVPSYERVLELLLFNKAIPRSVRFCMERVQNLIEAIGSDKCKPLLKINAKLLIKLQHDTMSDIMAIGQDKYIESLQEEVLALGVAIQEGYFITS